MKKAFDTLSSSLCLLNTKGDKEAGCVINTFLQVASKPQMVLVSVNKENYTCKEIQKSKIFNVSVLSKNADMKIINVFGFSSSEFNDKYHTFDKNYDILSLPYIKNGMVSLFSVRVKNEIDAGSHMIFLGEISESVLLSDDEAMTYDYYKKVKKGTTPPKAPNYHSEKVNGYKCELCGYLYRGENLPENYICPICGAIHFKKIVN